MEKLKPNMILFSALTAIVFLCSCSTLPFGSDDPSKDRLKPSAAMHDEESYISKAGNDLGVDRNVQSSVEPAAGSDLVAAHYNQTDVTVDENSLESDATETARAASDLCASDDVDCISTNKDGAAVDKEAQSILDEALDFCEVSQSAWQKGELESAFEALDKAYSLILEIDTKQDAKLIQQKEDLRFLISKRILEIYASRNIVVNGNHDEIPMEMNRHIEAELRSFTGREKRYFINAYQRSGQYRPYILEALKVAGLPEELSWLPLIESNFKVKALSKARALGLWQFIPSTGYKFGLKRNQYIDERIDFIKSTNAAIAYLKELHNIFGDWATVLAAYNCGEGRVLKVIQTQNINYLDNFWDLYQRLPLETARYVPRFFATLHIVKNPEKYGLDPATFDPPLVYDEVEINRQVHLKDLSPTIGAELAELQTLNPELRYSIVPPEPYTLRVPKGHADKLLAMLDTVPTTTLPQRAFVWHSVRTGETLGTISRRYRTSVKNIMPQHCGQRQPRRNPHGDEPTH